MAMTESIYTQILDAADDGLKELQRDIQARTSGRLTIHLQLQTGSIVGAVNEFCQSLHPDLIVVGVTGPTFEKFLLGSPVNALLHLRQPLLIIPDQATFHPYKQIALACDETDINRGVPHSFPLIKELQERFRAKIDIVNVETGDVMSNEACGYELAETRPLNELRPSRHYIRRPSVLEGLEDWLKDCPSELAVVFPKKHALLDFHPSQSRAFAKSATIPILSLPE